MSKRDPLKRHRFRPEVILLAVRWYCQSPLSYRDVRNLLAERGMQIDPGTINRWVVKFGLEVAKRSFTHRSWRGLTWHVDETDVRVGGRWRYLSRAVDHCGQLIDFRMPARRDAKAAKAFLRQAKDNARLYQPMTIVTDKAPTYARVIGDMNKRNFLDDPILHVDRKWRNNIIESDHASLKRLTDPGKGFQSLRTTKATLKGIEAFRTIKRGHVFGRQDWITGEVSFVIRLFGLAA